MNEITMKLNADRLIRMALEEDITSEDITTNSVMRKNSWEKSSFYAKRQVSLPGSGCLRECLLFWMRIQRQSLCKRRG